MVSKFAKRKGWSDAKRQAVIDSIVVTCDEADLGRFDLIVEAIVERLDVKQSLFQRTCRVDLSAGDSGDEHFFVVGR